MNGNGNGWSLWVKLAIAVASLLVVVVPLYVKNSPVSSNVQTQGDQIQNIEDVLLDAQVCTVEHPEFCVDLFERLQENITAGQRKELACGVIAVLASDVVEEIELESNCPDEKP